MAEARSSLRGRLAQLVEHLVYTERVSGSSPLAPTIFEGDFTNRYNLVRRGMLFILQKALGRHAIRMRGSFVSLNLGFVVLGAFALPSTAMARESEPAESASFNDPRHRHVVVRPLTESLPIRKAEKIRIRRILM